MEKGQIFTIKIEDMTDEGAGIGKADGYPLFVKDAVAGDLVRAELIKDKKTYGYARLLEVLETSPDRVIPACPVARPCGGCQLQALSYEAQLRFKEKKVKDALTRIGELDMDGADSPEFFPIISMENPWHYRNKAEYPIRKGRGGEIAAGFYAGRTHSIIECENCLIGQQGDGEILRTVKQWMGDFVLDPYDEETGKGLVRHVIIRTSASSGNKMVCLVVNAKKLPFADKLACRLGGDVTSFSYSINTQKNNVIMGQEVRLVSGEPFLEDEIDGVKYRISPQSFYQVNPEQTARLYRRALEFAGLTGGETVWDLYCGIGTISLFLAKAARKVYGVEIIPAAVENARENARLNGIKNVEFFAGKAEEVLPRHFAQTGETADVVVVDPPRKGCDEKLLSVMAQMGPEKIVYVSCNPATLARDLKILCGYGYRTQKVQPVDMFPWTVHVETVCLLGRLKPDDTIKVSVNMDDYYQIRDAEEAEKNPS